jgi:hypothetical protein
VIVVLVDVLLTAVHTLVFVNGDVVYSTVYDAAPVVPDIDQLTVALVLSALIVPIVGVTQVTVTGQPLVLDSLTELHGLDSVLEQFDLTLYR